MFVYCNIYWTSLCDWRARRQISVANRQYSWLLYFIVPNGNFLAVNSVCFPRQKSWSRQSVYWDNSVGRTRNLWSEVCCSNFGGGSGRIFISKVIFLSWLWCSFHLYVTAVAHKRPRSLHEKCRWQVTSKYSYSLDPTKSEWADYAAQA